MTKSDAIKHLWAILEKGPKSFSGLAENPLASNLRSALFSSMKSAIQGLEGLDPLELGQFYTYGTDERCGLIRLESVQAEPQLTIKARVVYCANTERIRWQDVKDTIFITAENFDNLAHVELDVKELPTHVSDPFVGTLLGELISG
jgi:hypothetical protein